MHRNGCIVCTALMQKMLSMGGGVVWGGGEESLLTLHPPSLTAYGLRGTSELVGGGRRAHKFSKSI